MPCETLMCKYLIILIGIVLVPTTAFGADSIKMNYEVEYFSSPAVEEEWSSQQIFQIQEDFSTDHNSYNKFKFTFNLMESDNISIPLTVKIKDVEIPKVRLIFKITF